jgi:hypothetical protein
MAQQGVPVSTAAAALGHDPAIHLRTYAHLYPGDLRSAADAMDAVRTAVTKGKAKDSAALPSTEWAKKRGVPQTSRGELAGMGNSGSGPEAPASP